MKYDGRRSLGGLLLLSVVTLVLATGCPSSPPPPPPPAPPPPPTVTACLANESWVSQPNPPQEIPGGGQDFCEFYQFAWQWFLYLVSPSENPDDRNFQVAADFPEFLAPADSCTTQSEQPTLFVRTVKSMDASEGFVIPERIDQAGSGASIYDQNGNVVYYNVRFDRGLCDAQAGTVDLPAGTTEIKTSWRILAEADDTYFTMEATIEGVSQDPVLLGLVGFHLLRTTTQHPEGVWATWEHSSNAPDCVTPRAAPEGGWSFTSSTCADCLANLTEDCFTTCAYNEASSGSLTGKPTEICRVYRDGTAESDNKSAENVADVTALNEQLVGPLGILTQLGAEDPMAVWKNYFNAGGLWVSDPSQAASSTNQRGSLQLTNSTMETTFQGSLTLSNGQLERGAAVNCFGCHNYQPNMTADTELIPPFSHIFGSIHGNGG